MLSVQKRLRKSGDRMLGSLRRLEVGFLTRASPLRFGEAGDWILDKGKSPSKSRDRMQGE